jgi:hypothetical protein
LGRFASNRVVAWRPPEGPKLLEIQRSGNSTMASPVATFSSFWLHTITSMSTQRDFAITCFDFTITRSLPPPASVVSSRVGRLANVVMWYNQFAGLQK